LKGLQSLVANGIDDFDGKIILLANDIDLSDNWVPIGSDTSPFKGIFDGKGYTISGLSVDVSGNAGLFGYVGANGQIKNVNVIASTIKGTSAAGVLAGNYSSSKPIENCSVKAESVQGSGSTGGLVGQASVALTIANCYASGNVSSNGHNSSNGSNGNNGSNFGYNGGAGYGGGAGGNGGGLVGQASAALIITNSYANGDVSSNGGNGGKGGNGGNANSSGNGGNGGNGGDGGNGGNGGGLVGQASSALTIANSYASGNISSNGGNGGSGGNGGIGYNGSNGSKGSSGSNGSSGYSGGLVGYASNTANITNSYVSGNISGGNSGGIFGRYSSGTMTSVYYKLEGASLAAGSGSPSGILGIPSNNLKNKTTFANWDFNEIWGIAEGYSYPYLKAFPPEIYIPLNDIEAEHISDITYTGSPITPEPKIKLSETLLTKGTDYELSYEDNKDAGTGKITIIGNTFLETMTFNIIPKTLTISNATAQSKPYDGTTAATITGKLEGAATEDDVSFNGAGTFTDKNAGNGKPVTNNITLTGEQAKNYKLTPLEGLTADITPKPLTITMNPKTITLAQSDPLPNFSDYLVYDGLVAGDLISGITNVYQGSSQLTAVPSTPDNYSITLTGMRFNSNYAITYDNTDLLLIVTADPVNLSTCTVADITAKEYTASQITPAVTVTCSGATLTADYYTIAYGENTNVATSGTVTITGKDGYTGTISQTFTINKKALTVTGANAENKTYDGTATATITDAELYDVIGTDAVSLANHTAGTFASANAGEGIEVSTSMTLTGTAAGNYSITQPSSLKANITPKALATDAIQAIANQTYSRSDITPAITVKDGNSTLASGTDYTINGYQNNRNVGTATVTITGTGNYTGIITANFTINRKAVENSMIDPIPPQQYTDGDAIEPLITVRHNSRELVEGTDYTVVYSNNTAPGTATVTITSIGNYTGTATASFQITSPKDIEDLELAPIPDQTYTGQAITPVPVLKDGSYTLVLNTDYTITGYQSNTAVGNARITISGTGNYGGTLQITFKIVAPPVSSSSSDTPSSSSVEPSSSSSDTPSSSSVEPSSSSSADTPSSSSNGSVPARLPQTATANKASQMYNGINLQATSKAVVEVYSLNGNLVSRQNFSGGVYTVSFGHLPKGMYIVKTSFGSEKKMLKMAIR